MVNILSVDFDWIMEPYIEFYNQFADDMSDLNMIVPDLNKINTDKELSELIQIISSLPKEKRQLVIAYVKGILKS